MYHRHVRDLADDQHAELRRMTQQEVGRVAERARMILLSARGFTVQDIMGLFEVVDETLYKWLDRFEEEGPGGLYDRERSGRPPEIDGEDLQELERLVETSPLDEGYEVTTWTTPLLRSHIAERMAAIEAALLEAKASSSVRVLFEDETDVRRLPPLRQMWMRRGAQARVPVPSGNARCRAATPGAERQRQVRALRCARPALGRDVHHALRKGRSDHTASFLGKLLERFAPAEQEEVVLVWDQASWHTSGATRAVVAGYDRLRVLLLPKRAPQENPVEDLWRALKRIVAAHLTRSLEALKQASASFFDRLTNEDTLRLVGLAV